MRVKFFKDKDLTSDFRYNRAMKKLNKHIILGVTGGIAAYKSAELLRRLQDTGATVQVVMTEAAKEFITPLTFQALSGRAVRDDLFDSAAEAGMGHIELARWADLILVAPATADFIADLAQGRAGHLLSTLCLATDAPIAVAPAMNHQMWHNTVTQQNLSQLADRNIHVLGPAAGHQACGETGYGRMLDVPDLVDSIEGIFANDLLAGKRVVITAGPTREALDPVRYLTNYSSGKMGFALAEAAVEAGAFVTLIAGPTVLDTPNKVERINIETAVEMNARVLEHVEDCDIFIGSAAVADYRPSEIQTKKIKKTNDTLTLELIRNPDIIKNVSALKNKPFIVGFAAETNDIIAAAKNKLVNKGMDLIIANDIGRKDSGFDVDSNEVTILSEEYQEAMPLMSKKLLAKKIIEMIAKEN